jgi:spore coat protein CotH
MARVPRTAVAVFIFALTWLALPVFAADPIFDQGRLHETRIAIDPADWTALRQNFRTNQYYAANLTIDGETVQQVGIRSRGDGSRSGEKPGLKVDFNRYVAGQEFHGYKSLVLDNLTQDASMLREPLAFAVFEAMGIAAPQISYTRLTVNDQYWGLYTLVEDVKKPFLEARLGDKEGWLYDYEHVGPYDLADRGNDAESYVPVPFQPETHEDQPDPSGLIAFIQAVNHSTDESFLPTVSGHLDVERFITYLATENAIAENDGFVGYAGINNVFFYQPAGSRRFVLIPWDKDTTFVSASWPMAQRLETNVLSRRLMQSAGPQQSYVNALRRAAGFVSAAYLVPRLRALYNVMRQAALTDTYKPFTNDEFELGVGGLEGLIAARQGDILAQLP